MSDVFFHFYDMLLGDAKIAEVYIQKYGEVGFLSTRVCGCGGVESRAFDFCSFDTVVLGVPKNE